jgi:hypothetical protein
VIPIRIKKMLKRREECDPYLMKYEELSATLLTESFSYFIFSPGYLRYCDVYRLELGRCHSLPFFLTFYLSSVSFYIKIN